MKRILKFIITSPLRKILTGTMIVTSTSGGSFVVPTQKTNTWTDIRREFEGENTNAAIAAELDHILSLFQNDQIDLEMAIRLSYLDSSLDSRNALDRFWTDYLTSQETGAVTFETLIALRDEALGNADMSEDDILRDWLWKTLGANDYDCVARQGTNKNCGQGNGLDGNNGTPNEGI